MRTNRWFSGRRTAPVLLVCMLVCGAAPPPAAAQCELDKLLAFDGATNDGFGLSVSISGDVAVVGAFRDDDNGTDSGSAYVIRWNGSAWVQEAKLTASDGAANDQFGFSVSVSGEVIVLGARYGDGNATESGSAYVFVKPRGGWVDMTQTAKLTASDGAAGDAFGISASIIGGVLVVGATGDDDNGFASGSAYMFRKPAGPGGWVTMTETAKLTASDGAAGDAFGISASIIGGVLVVGATGDDDNDFDSGSAYVFQKPPAGWDSMPSPINEAAKLLASDGAFIDYFGFSVSISGDVVVVGAIRDDDNGFESGSAYVFQEPPGGWGSIPSRINETAKLLASDGAAVDYFGHSVSISGDVAVIGAHFGDGNVANSGSAYMFVGLLGLDYNGNGIADVCEALSGPDITGPRGVPDGCVDAFDLNTVLAEWCSTLGGNPCGTCGP